MALSRITDDVLFVIIDALKIEDIIIAWRGVAPAAHHHDQRKTCLGAAALTKELGLGTVGLDRRGLRKAHEPRL